jgi:hypothetical protein
MVEGSWFMVEGVGTISEVIATSAGFESKSHFAILRGP